MKKTGIMILGMFFIIQTFAPDYTFATFYGNIYGRVVDEETKQGVPGVWVSINIDERISKQTNEKGEFDFQGLPGGYEYVLTVYASYKTPPLNRYFKQKYFVLCNLPKGKNLYLNDIILLKGVQIKGEIKVWDGTPVTRHLLRFELIEPDIFDPNLSGWYCETIENGYYESRPLPLNKELLIVATGLMDISNTKFQETPITINNREKKMKGKNIISLFIFVIIMNINVRICMAQNQCQIARNFFDPHIAFCNQNTMGDSYAQNMANLTKAIDRIKAIFLPVPNAYTRFHVSPALYFNRLTTITSHEMIHFLNNKISDQLRIVS
jgi:hypothetical protein